MEVKEIVKQLEDLPRSEQLEFMKLLRKSDVSLAQTKKGDLLNVACERLGFWVNNDVKKLVIELADIVTGNFEMSETKTNLGLRKRNHAPVDKDKNNLYIEFIQDQLSILKKYSSKTETKRMRGIEYPILLFGIDVIQNDIEINKNTKDDCFAYTDENRKVDPQYIEEIDLNY